STSDQVRLFGAPVHFKPEEELNRDLTMLNVAASVRPANGAKMLAIQLEGADPAYQAKLVSAAAQQIGTMTSVGNDSAETAKALLDAAQSASGPARKQLVEI